MQNGVGLTVILVILIGSTFNGMITPNVLAAGTLTNLMVEPTNNIFNVEAHYVIAFTTGTTGTIKTVDLTFPSGFVLTNTKLIEVSGIGQGTISATGTTLTYTITSPISIPNGTTVMIMLGKVLNNFATTNRITITTKDASTAVIDGPTFSPGFLLKGVGTGMIANGAVTNLSMANNSINSTQIKNGTITNANIANLASIAFSKLAAGLLPSSITVNSANIVDGSITKNDIASGLSLVTEGQQCIGKVVTGFDSNGDFICKSINFKPDRINTLDGTGNVGQYTSIAIGTDGFPVISYYDVTNGDLKLIHCITNSCSKHDAPTTPDTGGNVGQHTSIAIGTDGFPVISYYDVTNTHLKLVHCTNLSCSTHDTPVTPDITNAAGFYSSIVIGTDGFPVISYYTLTGGNLKLVHCTNLSCSIHDPPTTLAFLDDLGFYSSIAIGTDGFPVISYYDASIIHLGLIHCTNLSCSTHDTPVTPDTAGNVGQYTSIAIGTDGFPVISYFDNSNGNLSLVHCINLSCSTNNLPTTLDSTSEAVGLYTSIAIGTDGFPVISYYDSVIGDLKVIQKMGIILS